MPGDNTIGYTKPQTHTIGAFGSKEGIENISYHLIWNADTGIGDRENHLVILLPRFNGQLAPLRHSIHGIKDDIEQRLPQLRCVSPHRVNRIQVYANLYIHAVFFPAFPQAGLRHL